MRARTRQGTRVAGAVRPHTHGRRRSPALSADRSLRSTVQRLLVLFRAPCSSTLQHTGRHVIPSISHCTAVSADMRYDCAPCQPEGCPEPPAPALAQQKPEPRRSRFTAAQHQQLAEVQPELRWNFRTKLVAASQAPQEVCGTKYAAHAQATVCCYGSIAARAHRTRMDADWGALSAELPAGRPAYPPPSRDLRFAPLTRPTVSGLSESLFCRTTQCTGPRLLRYSTASSRMALVLALRWANGMQVLQSCCSLCS